MTLPSPEQQIEPPEECLEDMLSNLNIPNPNEVVTQTTILDPLIVRLSNGNNINAETLGTLGAVYVDYILTINKLGFELPENTTVKFNPGKRCLQQAREQVLSVSTSPECMQRLTSGYYDLLPKSLVDDLKLKNGDRSLFSKLAQAPDDILSTFLLWNASNIAMVSTEQQPLLDASKQRFRNNMVEAIRRGLPVSRQQLDTRLADTNMHMIDPFSAALEEVGGYFSRNSRSVHVAASIDVNTINHVISHELMHLVSGAKIVHIIYPGYPDDPLFSSVEATRCGIAGKDGIQAPTWINEAINEQLSMLISQSMPSSFIDIGSREFFSKEGGVYTFERSALQLLLGDSVSIPVMLGAHFEDTNPLNNDHLPLAEEFWLQIEDRYGKDIYPFLSSVKSMRTQEEYNSFIFGLRKIWTINALRLGMSSLYDTNEFNI